MAFHTTQAGYRLDAETILLTLEFLRLHRLGWTILSLSLVQFMEVVTLGPHCIPGCWTAWASLFLVMALKCEPSHSGKSWSWCTLTLVHSNVANKVHQGDCLKTPTAGGREHLGIYLGNPLARCGGGHCQFCFPVEEWESFHLLCRIFSMILASQRPLTGQCLTNSVLTWNFTYIFLPEAFFRPHQAETTFDENFLKI